MGPKIQAVIEFLEGGGWMGLITNPPNIGRALAGETGTFIVREGVPAFTFPQLRRTYGSPHINRQDDKF